MNEDNLETEHFILGKVSDLIGNFIFDLNNEESRLFLSGYIDKVLSPLTSERKIYSYNFICDETNNTIEVVDGYKLIVDLYVKYSALMDDSKHYQFELGAKKIDSGKFLKEMEEQNG